MLSFFSSSRAKGASQRPWGDGLIECSLTTLWYGAEWSTIDTDELVFLAPSLCSAPTPESPASGPLHYIENRFAAQIQATALKLGTYAGGGDVLARIRASGAINGFLARGSLSRISGLDGVQRAARLTPLRADQRGLWLHELFVLASIDRMLVDAAFPAGSAIPTAIERAGLAEALVASVHTRINAGYVYPAYAYAHELLMTGAWLGLLAAGRAAYMPAAVGDVLAAYLDRTPPSEDQEDAQIASILGFYAGLAGGGDRLVRTARKVSRSGVACLVAPKRRRSGAGPALVGAWNAPLAARLAARLAEAETGAGGL